MGFNPFVISCDCSWKVGRGVSWNFNEKPRRTSWVVLHLWLILKSCGKKWRHQVRRVLRKLFHRELCKWVAHFRAKFAWCVFSVVSVSPVCFWLLSLHLVLLNLGSFHLLDFRPGIRLHRWSVSGYFLGTFFFNYLLILLCNFYLSWPIPFYTACIRCWSVFFFLGKQWRRESRELLRNFLEIRIFRQNTFKV